jgi:hypothetical protein
MCPVRRRLVFFSENKMPYSWYGFFKMPLDERKGPAKVFGKRVRK